MQGQISKGYLDWIETVFIKNSPLQRGWETGEWPCRLSIDRDKQTKHKALTMHQKTVNLKKIVKQRLFKQLTIHQPVSRDLLVMVQVIFFLCHRHHKHAYLNPMKRYIFNVKVNNMLKILPYQPCIYPCLRDWIVHNVLLDRFAVQRRSFYYQTVI